MVSELRSSRRAQLQKILTPKIMSQQKKLSENKSRKSLEEFFSNGSLIIQCFLMIKMNS